MGALDLHIGWLHKHKACAEDALRDLKRGRRIEIDEKDVTQDWIATYEQLIAKYRELIAAYKASQSLKRPTNLRV
jgi:deoxyadenosine/deoxycytidine kinase